MTGFHVYGDLDRARVALEKTIPFVALYIVYTPNMTNDASWRHLQMRQK